MDEVVFKPTKIRLLLYLVLIPLLIYILKYIFDIRDLFYWSVLLGSVVLFSFIGTFG